MIVLLDQKKPFTDRLFKNDVLLGGDRCFHNLSAKHNRARQMVPVVLDTCFIVSHLEVVLDRQKRVYNLDIWIVNQIFWISVYS